MSDKRIIELDERSTLVNNDYIATDNTNGTAKVNGAILQQKADTSYPHRSLLRCRKALSVTLQTRMIAQKQ